MRKQRIKAAIDYAAKLFVLLLNQAGLWVAVSSTSGFFHWLMWFVFVFMTVGVVLSQVAEGLAFYHVKRYERENEISFARNYAAALYASRRFNYSVAKKAIDRLLNVK
jgi:hypothetical protein